MKTIKRSGAPINLLFILALIPGIIACSFMIGKADASPVDCQTEFYNGFFQQIDPVIQKQCGKKFLFYTRLEIKRMNDYASFKINK